MLDKKMREKWKRAVLLLGCMVLVFSGCGKTGDVKEWSHRLLQNRQKK